MNREGMDGSSINLFRKSKINGAKELGQMKESKGSDLTGTEMGSITVRESCQKRYR